MCEQTPVDYKDGDIVWVKLRSCWWPGEVHDLKKFPPEWLADFKKPPLAAVKFFDENSYEYVKSIDKIYYYNCTKKNEFIKKGLDLLRAKNAFMEKFPADVTTAEKKTNGNPNIIDDPMFNPEKKTNFAAILFGEHKVKRSPRPRKSCGNSRKSATGSSRNQSTSGSSKLSTTKAVIHPRFLVRDDHEVRILIQTPDKSEFEIQEAESIYNCTSCGFTTTRIDVIVLHNKSHIQGVYSTPTSTVKTGKRTPVKRGKKVKMTRSKTSSIVEDLDLVEKGMLLYTVSSDEEAELEEGEPEPKQKRKKNKRKEYTRPKSPHEAKPYEATDAQRLEENLVEIENPKDSGSTELKSTRRLSYNDDKTDIIPHCKTLVHPETPKSQRLSVKMPEVEQTKPFEVEHTAELLELEQHTVVAEPANVLEEKDTIETLQVEQIVMEEAHIELQSAVKRYSNFTQDENESSVSNKSPLNLMKDKNVFTEGTIESSIAELHINQSKSEFQDSSTDNAKVINENTQAKYYEENLKTLMEALESDIRKDDELFELMEALESDIRKDNELFELKKPPMTNNLETKQEAAVGVSKSTERDVKKEVNELLQGEIKKEVSELQAEIKKEVSELLQINSERVEQEFSKNADAVVANVQHYVHANISFSCTNSENNSPNFRIDNKDSEYLSALTTLGTVSQLTTNFDIHGSSPNEKSKIIEDNLVSDQAVGIDTHSSNEKGNLTFVTEDNLADGQVEIADVPTITKHKTKPITLTSFSVDFTDSNQTGNIVISGPPARSTDMALVSAASASVSVQKATSKRNNQDIEDIDSFIIQNPAKKLMVCQNVDVNEAITNTSAEGNILIQTDEQQILINIDAKNKVLLPMNAEGLGIMENSEGDGNPQDILAADLADTDVFQQEQSASPAQSIEQLSPNSAWYPTGIGNVLGTTLSLSSPIMTPLEVPSSNNKKIPDEESDILTTEVPKNVDLPITITDPNIFQTVAQQQLLVSELTGNLDLPLAIPDQGVLLTSAEMNSPSFLYSLLSLDESVDIYQKTFSDPISMPLLTEEPQESTTSDNVIGSIS